MSLADLPTVLAALGHDGFVAICHQRPGGVFASDVVPVEDVAAVVAEFVADHDIWFGVNPVAGPARRNAGRGTAEQIARLASLFGDIDVKPTGVSSFGVAHAVVADLSAMLGTVPTALTLSGHGLQPLWAIDADDEAALLDSPAARARARVLLRRFGRLVAVVAERHGGSVDTVFDLARVLRAPGTRNLKHPDDPKPVVTLAPGGAPLTIAAVLDVLRAYDITESPDDADDLGTILAPPAEWEHGRETCAYVSAMVAGWSTAAPGDRHPWLVAQCVRIAAAHRLGCFTQSDHARACEALRARFSSLLSTAGSTRSANPGEIADAFSWGVARVAVMDDARAGRELGEHVHPDPALRVVDDPSAPFGAVLGEPAPSGHALGPASDDGTPETYTRNDDGNALRLADTYGRVLRYCPERGGWLAWNGSQWRWDLGGIDAVERARHVSRSLPSASAVDARHKDRALSWSGLSSMVRIARGDPRLHVAMGDLDARPFELNTPGGVVDLRTGKMRDSDPVALHTRMTTVAPDDHEPPSLWLRFLATTFAGDPALTTYVQRLLGLSLLGIAIEQVMPFCYGEGANGKTTLLGTVMRIVGMGETGYAIAVGSDMLMAKSAQSHPTELARLAGARLVVTSELEDDQRFAEARVKQLTGRDPITGRFMRGDYFTFTPTHTLWLLANHEPQVKTGGPALWRRIRQVPFIHTVPKADRDASLEDRLVDGEGPAILAWMITGAVDYLTTGVLTDPASVIAATSAYEVDQDSVGRFVAERCVRGAIGAPGMSVAVPALRAAYESFCREDGEMPVSAKALTLALRSRFDVESERSATTRFYRGLRLDSAVTNASPTSDVEPPNPFGWTP